jgi:deoxyribodipyrimidine photolyase-related protein
MSTAVLIFPHQLFKDQPALQQKETPIYIVEESLFFRQYRFHKQKIALHRASMKHYATLLIKKGYQVEYIDSLSEQSDIRQGIPYLAQKGFKNIRFTDPSDDWLMRRIQRYAAKNNITYDIIPNQNFITPLLEAHDFFDKKKKYFQTDFYIHQRKKLDLLLQKDQTPVGGQWTFDSDNREKLPKNIPIPTVKIPKENSSTKEAVDYVQKYFPDHYGKLHQLYYPVTHHEAEEWLNVFLEQRFRQFGIYEDAMHPDEHFLFHSVLTPMLNIGLLSPQEIVHKAVSFAEKKDIPLNSLEGFIRQIIGWREFIHIVYRREGRKQRTTNYWQFKRKIPSSFWNGTTGIDPIDKVIQKTLQTGYCHHIERLMILGNFMLLCEFDPDEVYRWFMEMFVDAYDWVMVPNIYGMTQFADGGLMTTKPYISGSNYLLKMGWKKGEWCEVWDGLFWHFMHKQRAFFSQNPRLGMLLKTFDKMPAEKQNMHLENARAFLKKLDQHEHT